MPTIKFHLRNPKALSEYAQEQLKGSLENNILTLNGEIGTGIIKISPIQEGLFTISIDCSYKSPIKSIRLPSERNDYFVLNFHLLNTGLHILNKKQPKVLNVDYNVVLESSMLATEINLEANTPIQIFSIVISRNWIKKNILRSNSHENNSIQQIFTSEKAIYLLETINYKFSSPINSIFMRRDPDGIETLSDVILILKRFLEKIKQRNESTFSLNLSSQKLQSILESKSRIEINWQNTISVGLLAKDAGMSISSYRRTFKQVFGITPYQYALNYKMDRALTLLESKKHSVSEVGYMIGYSNLGQFSKIFKRVHSFSPNDVK